MSKNYFTRIKVAALSCSALLLLSSSLAFGASNVDANLDHLASGYQQHLLKLNAQPGAVDPIAESAKIISPELRSFAKFDAQNRVLVKAFLDGTLSIEATAKALEKLGAQVLDQDSHYRHGVIAAYLPIGQIDQAAQTAGVRSLASELKPATHVGKVTSQGSVVHRTDEVNNTLGITGANVTVGVISDSFNYAKTARYIPTTAEDDVASGDLPLVNVLQDFNQGGDEGRAMCQIVYDLAPHCNLAFATAFENEVGFANNIRNLRTKANCDVIVDDVSYFDEPVFSDGIVAQAVDEVATSNTLPGKKVVYCSSAGNDGNNGYRGTYNHLDDAFVRQDSNHGNLKVDTVDPKLTAGGWYNWNTDEDGTPEPFTNVKTGYAWGGFALFIQWDDLYNVDHGITTNYNLLVFDKNGNYLADRSAIGNSFDTQQPFKYAYPLIMGTEYQIAITKSTQTNGRDPQAATHVALYTNLNGGGKLEGKHFHAFPPNVPTLIGHAAAANAIGVGAYVYDWTGKQPYQPQFEFYSSPGPATMYFDAQGNRLTEGETRLKPEISGVDGVATTFFGGAYNGSKYSFFGTSAAAPHIAGIAALMIEAAGGPGKIAPDLVKKTLEDTAPARDAEPLASYAIGMHSHSTIWLRAEGEQFDGPNYITVNYDSTLGLALEDLTIDGTDAGLEFDTADSEVRATVGYASGGMTAQDVEFVPTSTSGKSKLQLKFTPGKFKSGSSIAFVVRQLSAVTHDGGGSADSLANATVVANQTGKTSDPLTAKFGMYTQTGYSPADGFGLADALEAVKAVMPQKITFKK